MNIWLSRNSFHKCQRFKLISVYNQCSCFDAHNKFVQQQPFHWAERNPHSGQQTKDWIRSFNLSGRNSFLISAYFFSSKNCLKEDYQLNATAMKSGSSICWHYSRGIERPKAFFGWQNRSEKGFKTLSLLLFFILSYCFIFGMYNNFEVVHWQICNVNPLFFCFFFTHTVVNLFAMEGWRSNLLWQKK